MLTSRSKRPLKQFAMVVRIQHLLLMALANITGNVAAHSTAYQAVEVDVDFSDLSLSLLALELRKITAAVETVRTEDWCGLNFVFFTGHAVSSEGKGAFLQELLDRRALYVAELLMELDVPLAPLPNGGAL